MPVMCRLYPDFATAGHAMAMLDAAGLPRQDIGLISRIRVAGGVALRDAALADFSLYALPGVGPVYAAGWIGTALAGARGAGAGGSIPGALFEAGHDEDMASALADGVRQGQVLLAVRAGAQDASAAQEILDHVLANPVPPCPVLLGAA